MASSGSEGQILLHGLILLVALLPDPCSPLTGVESLLPSPAPALLPCLSAAPTTSPSRPEVVRKHWRSTGKMEGGELPPGHLQSI